MFFKYLDEGIPVITPIIQLNLSKNKLRVNCLHKLQIFISDWPQQLNLLTISPGMISLQL